MPKTHHGHAAAPLGLTARQFFGPRARRAPGRTMMDACRATGIGYTTLQLHVNHGKPMSAKHAMALQRWSRGAIDAARTLGVRPYGSRA